MAIENIAAAALDPVKVKEQQRISPLDLDPVVVPFNTAIGEIPGREVGAEVRYHMNAAEHFGHPVEVALVGEPVALDPVVAPLDAALAPPAQYRDAIVTPARADPADIVEPEPALVFQPAGETMRNDAERGVVYLVVDRIGRGKEEQVAVEISDPLRVRTTFEHEQNPGRRT